MRIHSSAPISRTYQTPPSWAALLLLALSVQSATATAALAASAAASVSGEKRLLRGLPRRLGTGENSSQTPADLSLGIVNSYDDLPFQDGDFVQVYNVRHMSYFVLDLATPQKRVIGNKMREGAETFRVKIMLDDGKLNIGFLSTSIDRYVRSGGRVEGYSMFADYLQATPGKPSLFLLDRVSKEDEFVLRKAERPELVVSASASGRISVKDTRVVEDFLDTFQFRKADPVPDFTERSPFELGRPLTYIPDGARVVIYNPGRQRFLSPKEGSIALTGMGKDRRYRGKAHTFIVEKGGGNQIALRSESTGNYISVEPKEGLVLASDMKYQLGIHRVDCATLPLHEMVGIDWSALWRFKTDLGIPKLSARGDFEILTDEEEQEMLTERHFEGFQFYHLTDKPTPVSSFESRSGTWGPSLVAGKRVRIYNPRLEVYMTINSQSVFATPNEDEAEVFHVSFPTAGGVAFWGEHSQKYLAASHDAVGSSTMRFVAAFFATDKFEEDDSAFDLLNEKTASPSVGGGPGAVKRGHAHADWSIRTLDWKRWYVKLDDETFKYFYAPTGTEEDLFQFIDAGTRA